MIKQLQESLKRGINLQESKFHNQYTVEIGFPMTMGLQFTYSFNSPVYQYLGVQGKGDSEQQDSSEEDTLPASVRFNGRFQYL